jgi:hypothetical protein
MAAAGLDFSSSLSHGAPASRPGVIAGEQAGCATGGRQSNPAVPGPNLPPLQPTRFGREPAAVGGQAHGPGQPRSALRVAGWAVPA